MTDRKCRGCDETKGIEAFTYDGHLNHWCVGCTTRGFGTRKCKVCGIEAAYNYPGLKSRVRCSKHLEDGMARTSVRSCSEPGCRVVPVFNFEGEKGGIRCSAHRSPEMVDVANQRCEEPGCTKQPAFNFECERKGIRCVAHKMEGMVDVRSTRCTEPGCRRHPAFNFPGQTRRLKCGTHRDAQMVCVANERCSAPGCKSSAAFNFSTEDQALFCGKHREQGMVDVKYKKCSTDGCMLRPSFGFAKGGATACQAHKSPGMTNVLVKRCDLCPDGAAYGVPACVPTRCRKHRTEGMIYRPTKSCGVNGCDQTARYGKVHPERCLEHALPDDIDRVERACERCGRMDTLDERGWCINFCTLEEAMSEYRHRQKLREQRMVHVLRQECSLTPTLTDCKLPTSCAGDLERPDVSYDCGTHWVFVECDEDQHKRYCGLGEINRMKNIYHQLEGLPVVFIRFNPDAYRPAVKDAVFGAARRESLLVAQVSKAIDEIPVEPLTVTYMFYDGCDGLEFEATSIDPYGR